MENGYERSIPKTEGTAEDMIVERSYRPEIILIDARTEQSRNVREVASAYGPRKRVEVVAIEIAVVRATICKKEQQR